MDKEQMRMKHMIANRIWAVINCGLRLGIDRDTLSAILKELDRQLNIGF
jgi:hypothetical protein